MIRFAQTRLGDPAGSDRLVVGEGREGRIATIGRQVLAEGQPAGATVWLDSESFVVSDDAGVTVRSPMSTMGLRAVWCAT
jgi:hypothetical protein